MFKIGDVVRHVAQNVVGEVIEVDGDTVYIEQSNGCEMDFAAGQLVLEKDYQAKHDTGVRDDAASRANAKTYEAVIENLYPAIVDIGRAAHGASRPAPGVAPKSWDELSALQKLNVLSDATGVPVKAWIDANQAGAKPALGALQLSILAGRGGRS